MRNLKDSYIFCPPPLNPVQFFENDFEVDDVKGKDYELRLGGLVSSSKILFD